MVMTRSMNRIFLFAILSLFSICGKSQTITDLGQKCLAYWDMETGVSPELDRVGSNDATVSGATVVAGANGNCRSFDGVNDVLTAGVQALGNSGFISAWVKSNSTGGVVRRAVGRRFGQHSIGISSLGNYTGVWSASSLGSVAYNTDWHHLILAYNYTTTTLTLYLDGVVVNTLVVAENEINTTQPWQIGAHGNTLQFWNGLIDEVGLFTGIITTDYVNLLYNSGTTPDFDDWYYQPYLNAQGVKIGNRNRVIFLGGSFNSYKYIRESINQSPHQILMIHQKLTQFNTYFLKILQLLLQHQLIQLIVLQNVGRLQIVVRETTNIKVL